MPLLVSRALTKRFGGLVAINQLDLDVEEKAIHSIIGPNGAGKTTFFNCVTGFYRSEEGIIEFDGIPLEGLSPDRITSMGIARTYQNIRCGSSWASPTSSRCSTTAPRSPKAPRKRCRTTRASSRHIWERRVRRRTNCQGSGIGDKGYRNGAPGS